MTETPRMIPVQIDPEVGRSGPPSDSKQKIEWETLDTVWKLLRDGAARIVVAELAERLGEIGVKFDADKMFQAMKESGDPDAPVDYYQLGADDTLAAKGVEAAFAVLVHSTYGEMLASFEDIAQQEGRG